MRDLLSLCRLLKVSSLAIATVSLQVSCYANDLREDCKISVLSSNEKGKEIKVQLAKSESERGRGLMYRREMAMDRGMLFVFSDLSERSFWMKNTFIPLDIIFLDQEGSVVSILKNVPPHTTAPRLSRRPAQYVLELNGGGADLYQITDDTKINLNSCSLN